MAANDGSTEGSTAVVSSVCRVRVGAELGQCGHIQEADGRDKGGAAKLRGFVVSWH